MNEEFERGLGVAPRLEIAGGRVVLRDGFDQVVPNMSRADMARLQFGQLPHEPSLEVMMAGLFPVGDKRAVEFMKNRKIVRRVMPGGQEIASVTSNVWEAVIEPEKYRYDTYRQIAGKGQRRLYELAQVLTDSYLLDKFALTAKQMSTVRTMAVVDAGGAASYLQGVIRDNPDFVKYEISAGKYSRSKKWAKDSIELAAVDLSLVPAHIECAVIGQKAFLYGPGAEHERWCVFGPLWHMAQLRSLYAVVLRAGPAQACFALGMEITLLDLDIMNRGTVMSPTVELHMGPQDILPMVSSSAADQILSSDGRAKLMSMRSSMEPVFVDGEQVACAVRIAGSRVLINSHVVNSDATVEVRSALVYPQRMVSRDLWIARTSEVEHQMNWTLRSPVVGETVLVCYLRGDKLQYTAPVSVRSTDGSVIVLSLTSDMRPGMSGAAVVAVHDMALLGVYSGTGAQQAVASAFTPEHYTDLCTADAASEVSRSEAGAEVDDSLYRVMRSRGLGRLVDSAIESMAPIYDGMVHVGMGYQIGAEFRTTCDMVEPLTVGVDRKNVVFSEPQGGVFSSLGPSVVPGSVGPSVHRTVQYGEKVFVVGRDDQGPYISRSSTVRHIGVASKSFFLAQMTDVGHLPLQGGLVISQIDGAVVGQFQSVSTSMAMGETVRCVSVAPPVGVSPVVDSEGTVVEWLSRTFPMINPAAWPAKLLEEVFTHSSCGRYEDGRAFNTGNLPLAYIGDSVAKVLIGTSLRDLGVPHSKWQVYIQAHQTDKHMAQVCEDFGLHKWLRTGGGLVLPSGCKAHSSLLEALIGAVYIQENTADVLAFCYAVDVVSRRYVIDSGD